MDTHTCTRCREEKPASEFQKDARQPSGLTSQCRDCRKLAVNARKYPRVCVQCGRHRKLDPNGNCTKCNVAAGLRYCKDCRQCLPALLSFYDEKAVCKDCLGDVRATRRREREDAASARSGADD